MPSVTTQQLLRVRGREGKVTTEAELETEELWRCAAAGFNMVGGATSHGELGKRLALPTVLRVTVVTQDF